MKNTHRKMNCTYARGNAGCCRCYHPQQPRGARTRSESKLADVGEYLEPTTPQCSTLTAARRARGLWKLVASTRPRCAWFVEAVLPTGDSNVATDNLKSVAATL